MLELAKKMLETQDAHVVMMTLVGGGCSSLEAAQLLVEALKSKLPQPIQMKQIKIVWHEGTGDFDGFTTNSWSEFNETLEQIAAQHGSDYGYSKTKFELTWQDGEVYEGRLDVNTKSDKNVGQHILEHLNFYSGQCEDLPKHFTPETYQEYIEGCTTAKERKSYIQYMERYDILV